MSPDIAQEQSSVRVAELDIWLERVDPTPLTGGITNQNFRVEDRGRRYVVRVGERYPVHGVVRANELAASRAAHLAGLAPGVVHAEPGITVFDFIEGRTFTPEDVCNPANLERLIDMVRRCHRDIPQFLRGPGAMFWVFHVVRDYGHTLRDGGRHLAILDDLLARAARLETAVGPIDVVFGHNDLLAANFLMTASGCGSWTGSMPGSTRRCSISEVLPPTASFPSSRPKPRLSSISTGLSTMNCAAAPPP